MLVDALLAAMSTGLPPGVVERVGRRRTALDALDGLQLPVAVFELGAQRPYLRNRAWRRAMREVPSAIIARFAEVERTANDVALDELVIDGNRGRAYYTASIRTRRGCLGAPDGIVVICADVTEQVIARRLGVDGDALVLSGAGGSRADHIGGSWRRAIGDANDWQAVVHADDLARCQDAYAEAVRQRASSEIEARLRRVHGDFRWYRIQFFVDPLDARWSCTAIDIHDAHTLAAERIELLNAARAARADAEQANRLKDQFLASVSHELRAPVTTMLLWERVLREQHDSALRAQALDAIRQSAQAQSRLVGDLLDVSRAISGKLYVDLRTVGIGPLIGEALEAAMPVALAKGVRLTSRMTRPALVEGDVSRLRQVFDNLLGNAVKFTDSGGSVMLTTRREPGTIVIEIRDTGRGIASELLERIFQPFHQAEDLLTRRQGGLGLGLAISRQLVELHGGTLQAASAGPGHGSLMTVRLPTSRRRQRIETPRTGGRPVALTGKRLLVIDDDSRVREALVLLLRRTGAIIDAAASAAVGRTMLTREPDVIICDIAMPGEDGYSFIRTLRATGSQIPAIALTAHALEVDATRALDAGFDIHLAKPVSLDRLVTTIGSLVVPG